MNAPHPAHLFGGSRSRDQHLMAMVKEGVRDVHFGTEDD